MLELSKKCRFRARGTHCSISVRVNVMYFPVSKVSGHRRTAQPNLSTENPLPQGRSSLNPTQRRNNTLNHPLYHHRHYVYRRLCGPQARSGQVRKISHGSVIQLMVIQLEFVWCICLSIKIPDNTWQLSPIWVGKNSYHKGQCLWTPRNGEITHWIAHCTITNTTYRVIHKSLRDFRPLRYSSRNGHAQGEHVNRGRDTPKFLSYLTGARYVHPWWRGRCQSCNQVPATRVATFGGR